MKYLILALISTNLYASETKFKYGDRVRIIKSTHPDMVFYDVLNKTGTIINYDSSSICTTRYLVNYTESQIPNMTVCEGNLKKVK